MKVGDSMKVDCQVSHLGQRWSRYSLTGVG
jgi:hypothetical protein